MTGYTI